jgi:NADP-reducing hydrogenase subunit HndB
MNKIHSLDELNRFRSEIIETKQHQIDLKMVQVIVGLGSCGIAVGALDTLNAIKKQVEADRLEKVIVSQTGCVGLCRYEPIVEVIAADSSKVTYGHVTPEVARRILREHVQSGRVVKEFVIEA